MSVTAWGPGDHGESGAASGRPTHVDHGSSRLVVGPLGGLQPEHQAHAAAQLALGQLRHRPVRGRPGEGGLRSVSLCN